MRSIKRQGLSRFAEIQFSRWSMSRSRKQCGCNEKGPRADCSRAFALGGAAKGDRLPSKLGASRRRPLQRLEKAPGLKPGRYNGDALVDIVLLPVEGGVGLDDYVFV